MTEPLAVGLKIIDSAGLRTDDAILVLGGGTVGQVVTLWAANHGMARIALSDPHETHRRVALQLGATAVLDPRAHGFEDAVTQALGGPPTVVIDCVGRPGIFSQAAELAARHGRVVLAGFHTGQEAFERIVPLQKELTVLFPNFSTVGGFRHALEMLEQGRIDPTPLLGPEIELSELPGLFRELQMANQLGKVLVTFPSSATSGQSRAKDSTRG